MSHQQKQVLVITVPLAFGCVHAGMLQFMLRCCFFCFKAGMEPTIHSLLMLLSLLTSLVCGASWEQVEYRFKFPVKGFCCLFTCSFPDFSALEILISVSSRSPRPAGFLGFREGPVQPRAPGLLHLCCSQPQKKEVKGEAAAQQLR